MTINISRGTTDGILEEIRTVLASYQRDHPSARIDLYRQNSASVRVRIVDSDFSGMSKKVRHNLVWKYLDPISEDAQADISMLVLLAPTEVEKSMGNLEFEDPVPSVL
jgi:stress-induced morphogen